MSFNYLGSPGIHSPPLFCLIGRVFTKIQVANATIILITPASHGNNGKQSSNSTKFSTTLSGGEQSVTTSGPGSFGQKILAEVLSEKVVYFVSDVRRSGTDKHYKLPWRN